MNIDLLLTEKGEAGLIFSKNTAQKIAGILFDSQSGTLSLEFVDMDYLDLNIPIDEYYNQYLDINPTLHIGSIKDGKIGQAYQVPLMFTDDPYRNEIQKAEQPANPLMAFNYFVGGCIAGQPVHREDLGDEDGMGCILGDTSPSGLEFAPHLARRHALEAKPSIAPVNAPGIGLGGSTSGGGGSYSGGQGQDGSQSSKDDKK